MRIATLLFAATTLIAADPKAELQARQTMDEFMRAFNARDVQAWSATLNYPHVRFASNEVRTYNTADDFTRDIAEYPRRLAPWHHSRW